MRTVTLQELMDRARQYADMQNNNFITEPELKLYIKNACTKYWNLINQLGQDYNLITSPTTLFESNVKDYALPSDFLHVRGVDLAVSSSPQPNDIWLNVKPFQFAERNRFQGYPYFSGFGISTYLRYRIKNNFISFDPYPQGYGSFRIHYTPVMPDLLQPTDTIDGINGFEDYIVLKAAERMLAKEESDVSWVLKEINEFEVMIKQAADDRNRDRSDRVQDVNADINLWW